jgi:hypothetical protein
VANGIRFHFGYANRVGEVEVYLTNKVTGERTAIWSTDAGWQTDHPLLRRWLYEGLELLQKAHAKVTQDAMNDTAAKEQALADTYLDRFSAPPTMMD